MIDLNKDDVYGQGLVCSFPFRRRSGHSKTLGTSQPDREEWNL